MEIYNLTMNTDKKDFQYLFSIPVIYTIEETHNRNLDFLEE